MARDPGGADALASCRSPLIGVAIGYVFDESTAQLVFTISFVGLSVLGGLWTPISTFPDGLATIGRMLPSFHFANLGWSALAGQAPDLGDVLALLAYGLVFVGIVAWRYRASASSGHVANRTEYGDRPAADDATSAGGPPGSAGAGDDRRGPVSLLFRSAWLVFVAYPIVVLIADRPDPVEAVLVVAGVGLFVGLLALTSRAPDSRSRSSLIGPVIVLLLLAVATVLVLRDPSSGFYPFYFYASTGASACCRRSAPSG